MARFEIRYSAERVRSPASFWVHRAEDPELDAGNWMRAEHHVPPMPAPVPGRGFPVLHVWIGDVELQFASAEEVRHVIDVLSHNPFPSTRALSRVRHEVAGPNRHWLSRLPTKLRSRRRREQLVKLLAGALESVQRDGVPF